MESADYDEAGDQPNLAPIPLAASIGMARQSPSSWIAALSLAAACLLGAQVLVSHAPFHLAAIGVAGLFAIAAVTPPVILRGQDASDHGHLDWGALGVLVVATYAVALLPVLLLLFGATRVVEAVDSGTHHSAGLVDVSNVDSSAAIAGLLALMAVWWVSAALSATVIRPRRSEISLRGISALRVALRGTGAQFVVATLVWAAMLAGVAMVLWLPVQVLLVSPITAPIAWLVLTPGSLILTAWAVCSISTAPGRRDSQLGQRVSTAALPGANE